MRLWIDGRKVIVPLAVVLFLLANPYTDRTLPKTTHATRQNRHTIEPWDYSEEVVVPVARDRLSEAS